MSVRGENLEPERWPLLQSVADRVTLCSRRFTPEHPGTLLLLDANGIHRVWALKDHETANATVAAWVDAIRVAHQAENRLSGPGRWFFDLAWPTARDELHFFFRDWTVAETTRVARLLMMAGASAGVACCGGMATTYMPVEPSWLFEAAGGALKRAKALAYGGPRAKGNEKGRPPWMVLGVGYQPSTRLEVLPGPGWPREIKP